MLDQNVMVDANDVRRNPVHRQADTRKARPCTITKSFSATIVPGSYFSVGGMLLMTLKRPSRPGSIVGAVDVVRRPVALGCCIVPLVEKCVEGLKDKLRVLLFSRLIHFYPPSRTGVRRA